jgi:hypothetical protein
MRVRSAAVGHFPLRNTRATPEDFSLLILARNVRFLRHMFSRPTNEWYYPAGLIFFTLGAILILYICYKPKIHFPEVNPF